MPDFPGSAVDAAAEALWEHSNLDPERVRILARAALDAAWPHLASAVAEKIQAHFDAHEPPPDSPVLHRAWRRHGRIAAQVASLAFSTRDELEQAAAEALE